jgi:hypothetical protein
MEKSETIDILELRRLIERILDDLESALGTKKIEVVQNLYWEVGLDDAFDLTQVPAQLNVGSLVDDIFFLKKIEESGSPPSLLSLLHIYPILKYLAHSQKAKE